MDQQPTPSEAPEHGQLELPFTEDEEPRHLPDPRPEQVQRFVERSRAAQGLPPRIEDPATLMRVAVLLRLQNDPTGRPPRRPQRPDDKKTAQAPSRLTG